MDFRATNFAVTMLLLVGFTLFVASIRARKPLENNWPLLYWILLVLIVMVRPERTFYMPAVLVGLTCGLMLRFEFMSRMFVNIFRFGEFCVWAYVVYRGVGNALL